MQTLDRKDAKPDADSRRALRPSILVARSRKKATRHVGAATPCCCSIVTMIKTSSCEEGPNVSYPGESGRRVCPDEDEMSVEMTSKRYGGRGLRLASLILRCAKRSKTTTRTRSTKPCATRSEMRPTAPT